MGVINRNEPDYKHVVQPSLTDGLQIPSSTHTSTSSLIVGTIPISDHGLTRRQRRNRTSNDIDYPMSLSPNIGRRRQRRLRSEFELLSALVEEDEPEEFLQIRIPYKSSFRIILDNPDFYDILEDFTADDASRQEKLLEQSVHKTEKPKRTTAYANISSNIKHSLKTIRNGYQLQTLENEIVDFFSKSANGSYMNKNLSSFQRLLVHGIAQYYGLKSRSFDGKDEKRIIKVVNPNVCSFGEKRLYSIVQDNHSKR